MELPKPRSRSTRREKDIQKARDHLSRANELLNNLTSHEETANSLKKSRTGTSGFSKSVPISTELAAFMGHDGNASRGDVSSFVYSYIREHQLQNPENKKTFIPNEQLATLLNVDTTTPIAYIGGLQKLLKQHFV